MNVSTELCHLSQAWTVEALHEFGKSQHAPCQQGIEHAFHM
jgi:hypothetical protein